MARKNILIVEDDTIISSLIELLLRRKGYLNPAVVTSGIDAIRHADQVRLDLVLMDIRLGGAIDGTKAAQQIHEKHGTPIIFITAHNDAETRARAERAAPVGYLVKPFSDDAFYQAVSSALGDD